MNLGHNPGCQTLLLLGDGHGNFSVQSLFRGYAHHESRMAGLDGDHDLLGKPYTWKAPGLDIWLQEESVDNWQACYFAEPLIEESLMPLVNMKDMLEKAKQDYAVGAFNILDYNSMKAVVDAAESLKAPVIIQTSVKTVKMWGHKAIVSWANELCDGTTVPIALHLDHCTDVDYIRACIESGWTSVMIDASARPFEENMELTRRVVDMARPHDISVEAELGAIVGVEDDIHVKEQDAHLADLEQSLRFCAELEIDCFAPAIGTAHGVYKGEPKIAYDLVDKIFQQTRVPLALHGGTGLADEVFHKCIGLGCAKVNISTQLKYAHIDSFVQYYQQNPNEYNPLKPLAAQYQAVRKAVEEKIKLFGSAGRAA